jgi:hypothetical protein
MKTGQVARQSGVNIQTLRYYERRGLLQAPPRRDSGYREYGPVALRTAPGPETWLPRSWQTWTGRLPDCGRWRARFAGSSQRVRSRDTSGNARYSKPSQTVVSQPASGQYRESGRRHCPKPARANLDGDPPHA